MKAHLTERYVKGLQPKQKNIIVYDEEVVGFGVRITSGGTRALPSASAFHPSRFSMPARAGGRIASGPGSISASAPNLDAAKARPMASPTA